MQFDDLKQPNGDYEEVPMPKESNATLRVPLLRQRLMELVLRPTRELIQEEVVPLKRRIRALKHQIGQRVHDAVTLPNRP